MFCIISADIFGLPIHELSTEDASLVTDQPAVDERDLVTDQPEPQNNAIVPPHSCAIPALQRKEEYMALLMAHLKMRRALDRALK